MLQEDIAVAYGAHAAAPNCVGMIEDLSTLQSARRKGIATAMIAAFTDRLRADGCHAILLGAFASEQPKHLNVRLGFRPLTLSRAWVRELPATTVNHFIRCSAQILLPSGSRK